MRHRLAATGNLSSGSLVGDLIAAFDVHFGTPDQVIASLQADATLERATDLTMQVHSIDPPHPFILRSIELMAEAVAPALGWVRNDNAAERRVLRRLVLPLPQGLDIPARVLSRHCLLPGENAPPAVS